MSLMLLLCLNYKLQTNFIRCSNRFIAVFKHSFVCWVYTQLSDYLYRQIIRQISLYIKVDIDLKFLCDGKHHGMQWVLTLRVSVLVYSDTQGPELSTEKQILYIALTDLLWFLNILSSVGYIHNFQFIFTDNWFDRFYYISKLTLL